jgi:hypothetical protein
MNRTKKTTGIGHWKKNQELARRDEQISRSNPRSTRKNEPLENEWELAEMGERRHLHSPHPTFNIIAERADNSLLTQGWIGNKPCLITMTPHHL